MTDPGQGALRLRVAATVIASIIGLTALAMVATELPAFFDPCHSFGAGSNGTISIAPDEPCQSASATSETKAQVIWRLALVQGMTAVACALALVGAGRSHPTLLFIAAGILAAESVVLGVYGVVTMAAGLVFVVAGIALRRPRVS